MDTRKQLLVTGAHGFVAGSVLAQASADWLVLAVSRSPGPAATSSCIWHVDDVLAPGPFEALFQKIHPDAVIHTAALADIDFCESHREQAAAVNVDLTARLVNLCSQAHARLVLCSTDTVFDGERAPYRETDSPGPVNFYAETKVAAERLVSRLGARGVIARLSLVMGLPVLGIGNSGMARMLTAFREGRVVAAPEEEIRTPIHVLTAGKALLELAAGDYRGIFHLGGLSRMNRCEIARVVARNFGFSPDLVQPQAPSAIANRARRPRDVSLDCRKAQGLLNTPLLTLEEGLRLTLTSANPTAL
jgi:dTDP-4-dehydrorhamnose reductase